MHWFLVFFVSVTFTSSEWAPAMENPGLYEGDMILDPEQLRAAQDGRLTYATTIGKQWPGAIVYYDYKLDVQARPRAQQVIQQAIAEYHKKTCIRFKKRTTEPHYIQFHIGQGCSSYVGYGGGRKWPMPVSLAQGCWRKGIVIHELGHALGMFHEQSRPDRDEHVKINWQNIEKDMEFNFKKQKSSNIDSLGTVYDYASVMHYGQTAFGIKQNNKRLITIETIDSSKQSTIGNRIGLSPVDVLQINKLYKCKGTLPPPSTEKPVVTENPSNTKKPVTVNPTDCKDSNERSCPGWRSICVTHPHIASICKKTCKLC